MDGQPQRQTFNPCGIDIQYTDEERVFLQAVDRYKKVNKRPYPTWHEVLAIVHSLGYRKVEPVSDLPKFVRHPGHTYAKRTDK